MRGPGGAPSLRSTIEFGRSASLCKLRKSYSHAAGIMTLEVWGVASNPGLPASPPRLEMQRSERRPRDRLEQRGEQWKRSTNKDSSERNDQDL